MQFYAYGESLIDIVSNTKGEKFSSVGGSLVNSAISLARSGRKVYLITEYGNDKYGNFMKDMLLNEKIDLSFSSCFDDGNTALAFAELDEESKAQYTFSKNYPQKRFENFSAPNFDKNSCLLFGSFSSISSELQCVTSKIISLAQKADSMIFYDPNIRHKCLHSHGAKNSSLKSNFQVADIIKLSDEDLQNILETDCLEKLISAFELNSNQILIMTKGPKGVSCLIKDSVYNFEVPKIAPVSTIGAGDSFSAGILNWLDINNFDKRSLQKLSEVEIKNMIEMGIAFATEVCMSKENYIGNRKSEN